MHRHSSGNFDILQFNNDGKENNATLKVTWSLMPMKEQQPLQVSLVTPKLANLKYPQTLASTYLLELQRTLIRDT
jgi:hypothetical protein